VTTETFRLGDVVTRLDDRLEELADLAVENENYQGYRKLAGEVETQLAGVMHLVDKYSEGTTIEISSLNAGEFAQVEDRIQARKERSQQSSVPGYRDNVMAAAGLEAAPFLDERDEDADDQEWLTTRIATVGQLDHPGVAKWLASEVNEITTARDTDFRSFKKRFAERSGD
jgi:hypothetical protein